MADILENRKSGEFTLERFTITKDNISIRNPLPCGDYVRLMERGEVVMSDTPMEKRTNKKFIRYAHGDVFIAGLGIGLVVLPIQEKEDVTSITILEKNPEIIEMVGEQLPLNDKVTIIQGMCLNILSLKVRSLIVYTSIYGITLIMTFIKK